MKFLTLIFMPRRQQPSDELPTGVVRLEGEQASQRESRENQARLNSIAFEVTRQALVNDVQGISRILRRGTSPGENRQMILDGAMVFVGLEGRALDPNTNNPALVNATMMPLRTFLERSNFEQVRTIAERSPRSPSESPERPTSTATAINQGRTVG
jgi:hypothetical protein